MDADTLASPTGLDGLNSMVNNISKELEIAYNIPMILLHWCLLLDC